MESTSDRTASGTIQPVKDVMGIERMCVVDDNGENVYILPPDISNPVEGSSVVVWLYFNSNKVRKVLECDESANCNGHLSYRIGAHGKVIAE